MADARLDALFLTSETDVRYFTGYLTRFWESPTRPWYLLVPLRKARCGYPFNRSSVDVKDMD